MLRGNIRPPNAVTAFLIILNIIHLYWMCVKYVIALISLVSACPG